MRIVPAISILLCLSTAAPVAAQDGGLASMHSQRREGGRVCMVDHFHYGTGSGSTKKAALADAVSSWQSFTDFEYGRRWSSWARSASKQVKYAASATGFSADVSSRPCR